METNEINTGTVNIEGLGLYLRQLREERKIPVAQVAQALKTKIETIQAIEANDFEKIPAPTYVKGYLRSYASYLDIDTDPILAEYNKKYPYKSKQEIVLPGLNLPKIGLDIGTIIKSKIFIYAITIILALLLLFFGIYTLSKKTASKNTKTKGAPISEQKVQEQKETENNLIAANMTEPISTPIRLTIRTLDNVWLRVNSDDKALFEGVIKKNETENWQAQNEFKLRIGNPSKLNLTINGKSIGSISPYGPVNVTINKNGINIEK